MKRVVVTGMGVVAPNAAGLKEFEMALRENKSGLRYNSDLEAAGFHCRVSGVPPVTEALRSSSIPEKINAKLKNSAIVFGIIAGVEAWADAGLAPAGSETPDWESGCIFGAGMSGMEMIRDAVYHVDAGKVKALGSRFIERTMASSISAHLGGLLGLGNQVTTNASACTTGTESIVMAAQRIALGQAERMMAGGCDGHGAHIWAGFDSMMVLNREHNDTPAAASRPMSASARGFIPGAGAGALVLESLESAQRRGARIYAEIAGGAINSGGHRGTGTMTAPNLEGTQRCVKAALSHAGIRPEEVDAISGHLTGTMGDAREIETWTQALGRRGKDFPRIHSLKSLIGHCLSAAGAIESVATVLELHHGFFHASANCEDLHPEIEAKIARDCIPSATLNNTGFEVIAKASFGFGDVNACAVFRKWKS